MMNVNKNVHYRLGDSHQNIEHLTINEGALMMKKIIGNSLFWQYSLAGV